MYTHYISAREGAREEHQQARKADREDLQVITTRLSFFERLNLPDLKGRIDSVEVIAYCIYIYMSIYMIYINLYLYL